MKKLVILFLLVTSLLNANRFWGNSKNYKQVLTVESILSYSPSVVNYAYGDYNFCGIVKDYKDLKNNNDFGYYFTDCIQWSHLFNLYPVFQTGFILNYHWSWGLKIFSFSNLYRMCGFNFDIYNISFNVSFFDMGFVWYKYEWSNIYNRDNVFYFIFSPITSGISYRINLNKRADIFINLGYSMQMTIDNKLFFPNKEVNMTLENQFDMGIGFKFYTKDFR